MAFSKNPQLQTYQTKTVPLAEEINSRSASLLKDEDCLNCYQEYIQSRITGEKEFYMRKRDGTEAFIEPPGAVNRGMYFWEDQSKIFVAMDDDILVYSGITGTLITTLNAVFPSTTGDVGFEEFLYDTGAVKLVVTDGTKLSTIDAANVVVPCVDVDLPVPHRTSIVFLDGYLFLIKSLTADIYNSNLNDPLTYTAGDFISAEMLPDQAVKLARLNNYLVVFGNASIEYFWDAGIDTGSPLQRNDTPVKLVGYLGGFAKIANRIFFIGTDDDVTPNIFMLEDFKITPVGTETIRRYLISIASYTLIAGNIVSIGGHDFYAMSNIDAANYLTWVMDLETKLWSRWSYRTLSGFPIADTRTIVSPGLTYTVFTFQNDTRIYRFRTSLYWDSGINFEVKIVTRLWNFDSYNYKTMSRLMVYADRPNLPGNLIVYTTDDDYQTYSAGQSINLNQDLPCNYRWGMFRRRAFKLSYTDNQPMRLRYLEVDINLGKA